MNPQLSFQAVQSHRQDLLRASMSSRPMTGLWKRHRVSIIGLVRSSARLSGRRSAVAPASVKRTVNV